MTRTLSIAGAALAAFMLVATAHAAAQQRQTPGSRITVNECNPHRHMSGTGHPWIDPYGVWHSVSDFPYTEGFLAIGYRNDNKSADATEVDFGLVARGTLIAVTKDVGSFAPGVTINHEFSVSPEIFPIGTALPYCAVLRVKYADGSEWHNPNPPQA